MAAIAPMDIQNYSSGFRSSSLSESDDQMMLSESVSQWRDTMEIEITPASPHLVPSVLSPSSFQYPPAMQWEGTSPPTPALFDAWPAVDQNYCKDFTCCGLELPGLHELLQHYEERHVQHQQFSDDESLLTSPVTPMTASPRSSVGPEGPATPPPSSFPYTPTDMKFSYPPYPSYPAASFYNPEFPVSEPYTVPVLPHVPSLVPEYDVMHGFDPLDHDSPAYSVPPSLVNKPMPEKPKGLGITIPSIDTKTLTSGPLAGRKIKYGKDRKSKKDDELPEGQKRVKPFKCKVPGCTKAYLNSNGLRYHMQKGTCVLSGPAPEEA